MAEVYLNGLGLGAVVHEPDGNVPPDFVVGDRIAVEVRRLNQHYMEGDVQRSLEQGSIPFQQGFVKLLEVTRPVGRSGSWFVMFSFSRPLVPWRHLRQMVRAALLRFAAEPTDEAWRIPVAKNFKLTFLRSSKDFGQPFVLGGYTDMDAGGWVASEVIRNLSAYVAEKTVKVLPFRSKYPEWWLLLVDHIALARDDADVREHYSRPVEWDRIVLISPSGDRAYAI